MIALTVMGLFFLATAALGQEVCPEDGKIEAQGEELDDIVLEEGTEVCIKGGTDVVYVVADGESTLFALLGNGHSVSHYTVVKDAPPTTTTTRPDETTTTTRVEETTTTTGDTSTTSTTAPVTTTTTVDPPEPPVELPYTGAPSVLLAALGLTCLVAGGAAVRFVKD